MIPVLKASLKLREHLMMATIVTTLEWLGHPESDGLPIPPGTMLPDGQVTTEFRDDDMKQRSVHYPCTKMQEMHR